MRVRTVLLAMTLAFLATGCPERTFGSGIGTPGFDAVQRAGPSGLEVVEIFLTHADPAIREVEVLNTSADDYDESTRACADKRAAAGDPDAPCFLLHRLCGDSDCVDLGPLPAGARATYSVVSLGLSAAVGEVAVVDDDNHVTGYVAWGAPPASQDSSWSASALANGVPGAGDFIPSTFPMPADTALVREGTMMGCGPRTANSPPMGVVPCAAPSAQLSITELFLGSGHSWVEIQNDSAGDLDLYGARLCHPPHCNVFSRGTSIAAGARALVNLGLERPDDDPDTPADELAPPAGEIDLPNASTLRATGEVALLAPGAGIDDSTAFLAFVRYGDGDTVLVDAAVTAGLWDSTTATAGAPTWRDDSLSLDPGSMAMAADWRPTVQTPLMDNSMTWSGCSFPDPMLSAGNDKSDLAIARVAPDDPAQIEIINRNGLIPSVPLANWVLKRGTEELSLTAAGPMDPPEELMPGQSRLITVKASCAGNTDGDLCWSGVPLIDASSGELTLIRRQNMMDSIKHYVRWGITNPSMDLTDAIAAGRWPGAGCTNDAIAQGTGLELDLDAFGWSPADYR